MELNTPETTPLSLMPLPPSALLVGVASVMAGVMWLFQVADKLPPGPPVYMPVLGHLLKMASKPIEEFRALRQRYGDVFRLYLGSKLVVVINGYDVIKEVLLSRGSEFAHRPASFLKEKMAEDMGILNTSGAEWYEQKVNVLKTMRELSRTGGQLDQNVDAALTTLTSKLRSKLGEEGVSSSVDVMQLIRRAVCSVSFATVYGRRLDLDEREIQFYTEKMDALFRHFGALAVVNFLPYVQHVPGDPVNFHACIDMVKQLEVQVVRPELERLKQEVESSESDESRGPSEKADTCLAAGYVRDMIRKKKQGVQTNLREEQLIRSAGDLMAGSYDPVANTLLWVLLYMCQHPEVQERCHKEVKAALDECQGQVIEAVRRGLLNFTAATVMEVQRLANVAPFVPSHCSMEDTVISGYVVPKETILMINMDSLMCGPHVGEDWQDFRPQRFLNESGSVITPDWFMPYGTGPRICIGANVSKREMVAFTAALLGNFKFSPAVVDGRPCPINLVGDVSLTHVPKPFTLAVETR